MVAAPVHREPPPGTVRFWPRGGAAALFREHGPECVLAGPAGTGKTYAALWRLHLAALKYPGMRGIMVRKTLESLTASALVTYQTRILGAGAWGVQAFGGSKLRPAGFRYPTGSELLVGGLDKPEKVMSQEYDLVFVNEAADLSAEDWETLTTRTRWGRMPYQQVFGDCNPRWPGHWIYQRHLAGTLRLLTSVHEDNPDLYDGHDWTARGRAYLATLDQLTGVRRDRLRAGLWVADDGAVFRTVAEAATAEPQETPIPGHDYLVSVDWGKQQDFTVLAVWDATWRHLVALDRFQRIDYRLQLGRLQAVCERFRPMALVPERNSIGEPLIEEIARADWSPPAILPFTTTNASKALAVEAFALALEQETVKIIDDPVLVGELQAFEADRLPSGLMRYQAPPGMHDDCVMAAIIGHHALVGGMNGPPTVIYDEPVTISTY